MSGYSEVEKKKKGDTQISFGSIIEESNKKLDVMSQLHGYFFRAGQSTLTVGANGINRVLAISRDNIEEIATVKLRSKRFYERLGKAPILAKDGGKDGDLILKKGQSVHFVNIGIMSFCDKISAVVPISKILSSIANEGFVTNIDSYVLDEYNPKIINNYVDVFEIKKDISYREWAGQKNLCTTDFPNLRFPNPLFNLDKIGGIPLTRYDVQNTDIETLNYIIGNDAMTYDEIVPLLNELGTLGLILETRGGDFEEYAKTDKVLEMAEDEYMQQKMYTFGIPNMFISGVVMSDCAAINDDISKIIYDNFSDRYIYNSRGKILNNPIANKDLSEDERYIAWNQARSLAVLSEDCVTMEKC